MDAFKDDASYLRQYWSDGWLLSHSYQPLSVPIPIVTSTEVANNQCRILFLVIDKRFDLRCSLSRSDLYPLHIISCLRSENVGEVCPSRRVIGPAMPLRMEKEIQLSIIASTLRKIFSTVAVEHQLLSPVRVFFVFPFLRSTWNIGTGNKSADAVGVRYIDTVQLLQ